MHLSGRHRRALEALLREHLPDVEVWAYGSRVNGLGHEGSDLDLVLRGPGLEEIPADRLWDFAHSLAETYAVLTRLPGPNRLRSGDAIALLEANWRETPVAHLTAAETWDALRRAERRGVTGGQTYDMLIAACALKADASTIITWNLRHYAAAALEIGIEAPP